MKNLTAFVLAGVSAYAFSFALDLFFGALLGVYPSTAFLPVVTWSIIAAIAGVIALRLAPTGRFLVVPCLRYFGAKFGDDFVAFENVNYGNAIYLMRETWPELRRETWPELSKRTRAGRLATPPIESIEGTLRSISVDWKTLSGRQPL
jgi:hypothetical protein